jgi:hypothetical protein
MNRTSEKSGNFLPPGHAFAQKVRIERRERVAPHIALDPLDDLAAYAGCQHIRFDGTPLVS